jgi:hypothetical protein
METWGSGPRTEAGLDLPWLPAKLPRPTRPASAGCGEELV